MSLTINDVEITEAYFNGVNLDELHLNGVNVLESMFEINIDSFTAGAEGINLRFLWDAVGKGNTKVRFIINGAVAKVSTGDLDALDAELVNYGEIQGIAPGGSALTLTSQILLVNSGWIRGAGGHGGTGGKGRPVGDNYGGAGGAGGQGRGYQQQIVAGSKGGKPQHSGGNYGGTGGDGGNWGEDGEWGNPEGTGYYDGNEGTPAGKGITGWSYLKSDSITGNVNGSIT